jgi:hypothetical protein
MVLKQYSTCCVEYFHGDKEGISLQVLNKHIKEIYMKTTFGM